jgi:hypothetical protein
MHCQSGKDVTMEVETFTPPTKRYICRMIHSVPVIDFVGVLQVQSLEIGSIEVDLQPIPAVRFVLKQNKPYPILVSGHLAGEVYAYCAAALEKEIGDIDVKIACVPLLDINQNLHAAASSIAWYTSRRLREHAAASMQDMPEKGVQHKFKTCGTPFIVVAKSGKP